MNREEEVLKIIKEYHTKTNGKCGITIPEIIEKSCIENIQLRLILNHLYTEKAIKTRKGINGILIFLYDKSRTQKKDQTFY